MYKRLNNYPKNRTQQLILTVAVVAGLMLGTMPVLADTEEEGSASTAEPLAAEAYAATAAGYEEVVAAQEEAARQAVKNPLTGLGGYNEGAVGQRPIALVVENDPKARPQWGIDDSEKAPDIILEGEMEGGETRTLWLYADMTSLPSQAGPIRSARPPYVRFSELFDAIFIHCGYSHTTWDYSGADAVFENDGVDHIDMLTYANGTGLFDRDYSRTNMLEHTAFLRGEKVVETVNAFGFRTELDESRYTTFEFKHEEEDPEAEAFTGLIAAAKNAIVNYAVPQEPEEPVGTPCSTIDVQFSSATDTKHFAYSETDGMYHTQDYYTDVARKNVLLLFDTTQYIRKADTWGPGQDELYCNYTFAGGQGKLAYDGRVQDVTWTVENGKIILRTMDGETAKLAPGKIWIGWCSENYNGVVTIGE